MLQEIISSFCSFNTLVNPQAPLLVEASAVSEAPDHHDLGDSGVVDPPLSRLQEEVSFLSPAGRGLRVSV